MKTGTCTVSFGEQTYRVTLSAGGEVRVDDGNPLVVSAAGDGAVTVSLAGRTRRAHVLAAGARRQVFVDGEVYDLTVGDEGASRRRASRSASDQLSAPMPAKVTAIEVEPGRQVRKGDVLVKLEAMKMEMAVRAPRDGTVERVGCRVGELVQPGVPLLDLA